MSVGQKEQVHRQAPLLMDHYRVYVDYTESASLPEGVFDEMEKMCGRGFAESTWVDDFFCQGIDRSPGFRTFYLNGYEHGKTRREIVEKVRNLASGYRPATHEELMAFTEAYASITGEYWIGAPGSSAPNSVNGVMATVLSKAGASQRYLRPWVYSNTDTLNVHLRLLFVHIEDHPTFDADDIIV